MDRWQPYANAGPFRRWEGNSLDVVDWSSSAKNFMPVTAVYIIKNTVEKEAFVGI